MRVACPPKPLSLMAAGALCGLVVLAVLPLEDSRLYDGLPREFLGPIGFVSRHAWTEVGPDLTDMDLMGSVQRITLHHEGGAPVEFGDPATTARRLESIRRFHRTGQGWADIGYHFVLDRAGRLWEGRSLIHQGAHAGNRQLNSHNLGLMVLGNFDLQELPDRQAASLGERLEELLRYYSLDSDRVFLHSDLRNTNCPGRAMSHWFQDWRLYRPRSESASL